MKLLFLDTETTGLKYQEDEIIEIGALVLEWVEDKLVVVDSFDSLVKPRNEVGEQTTRITGIDNKMLSMAPEKSIVHEQWYQWLSKYSDIAYVVGHYIEFDLSFLQSERWYLPDHTPIDTLDLAKLFCPDSEAVNLERLAKKYELKPLLKDDAGAQDAAHHRALYDSAICAALYQLIVKRIYSTQWPQSYIPFIEDIELGTDRQLYSTEVPALTSVQPRQLTYSWAGDAPYIPLDEHIAAIRPHEWIEKLTTLRHLPTLVRSSLLQMSVLAFWKWQGKHTFYHKGMGGSKLVSFIIRNHALEQKPNYVWPHAFTLFESLGSLYKRKTNITSVATLADELENIVPKGSQVEKLLHDFSVQYDFIMFQLKTRNITNQWTVYNEVPRDDQNWIRDKLQQMKATLTQLIEISWGEEDYYEEIKQQFDKLLSIISAPSDLVLRVGRFITISSSDAVHIHDSLNEVLSEYTGSIPTRYSVDNIQAMESMLGFKPEWSQRLEHQKTKEYNVWQGIPHISEIVQPPQKGVKVVLCGQNSNLKDCWKEVDEHGLFEEVLVLGEIGSTNKIISKLLAGFRGTVVVRSKDWKRFVQYAEKFEIQEIIHLHPPYWSIDSYWYLRSKQSSDSDEFMSKLKKLRSHGQLLAIQDAFSVGVTYVGQYIT